MNNIPENRFSTTELMQTAANRDECRVLARIFKELCCVHQDFESGAEWRDIEKTIDLMNGLDNLRKKQ